MYSSGKTADSILSIGNRNQILNSKLRVRLQEEADDASSSRTYALPSPKT